MDWFDQVIFAASSASSSDDCEDYLMFRMAEAEKERQSNRGSHPGRRANINRDFRAGHERLYQDYFSDTPTYDSKHFLRRFRLPRELFLQIMGDLESADDFFKLRCDAAGKIGLSPMQKCTVALRMLAYGASADSLDENLRIGESTSLLTLRKFCEGVISIYGPEYLRPPTADEAKLLMEENEARGFPGMIGSLDCMHWVWKNCPVALKGQFQGKEGKPTQVLEVVASQTTYIWHCFFGCPGTCNDINILDRSPLLNSVIQGDFLGGNWSTQEKEFDRGYFLADGIYPDWPMFLKTIPKPQTSKDKYYAKCQEAARKDVERCFGVLRGCWHIIDHPCRIWDEETITKIMLTCVILHNMRLRWRANNVLDPEEEAAFMNIASSSHKEPEVEFVRVDESFIDILEVRSNLRDSNKYLELRNAIVNHLWAKKGDAKKDTVEHAS